MTTYPQAYIEYLAHFHGDRDFFECHEILEEYWKEHPAEAGRQIWVGLIQIAVALYHQRRGNIAGAAKMMRSAIAILAQSDVSRLGLDGEKLPDLLNERLAVLQKGEAKPYRDLDLPIADQALLRLCRDRCSELGLVWGQPSDLAEEQLIHRHTLRDRTDVIRERLEQHTRKARGRGAASS